MCHTAREIISRRHFLYHNSTAPDKFSLCWAIAAGAPLSVFPALLLRIKQRHPETSASCALSLGFRDFCPGDSTPLFFLGETQIAATRLTPLSRYIAAHLSPGLGTREIVSFSSPIYEGDWVSVVGLASNPSGCDSLTSIVTVSPLDQLRSSRTIALQEICFLVDLCHDYRACAEYRRIRSNPVC